MTDLNVFMNVTIVGIWLKPIVQGLFVCSFWGALTYNEVILFLDFTVIGIINLGYKKKLNLWQSWRFSD